MRAYKDRGKCSYLELISKHKGNMFQRDASALGFGHAGCFIGVSKRKLVNISKPSCYEVASDHLLKIGFRAMSRPRALAAPAWRVPERQVLIL